MRGSQTINNNAVDRYTLAHFAWGVILGAARLPWWGTAGAAVGWEIIERPLKNHFPKVFPYSSQDTLANAAVDALAIMAGWGLWRGIVHVRGK
jgi:hypothetical protein